MKRLNVKIWPEVTSYLPALIKIPKGVVGNPLLIDFSNVEKMTSSGANLLLISLLQLIRSIGTNDIEYLFNEYSYKKLSAIHFFDFFNFRPEQKSLFQKEWPPIRDEDSMNSIPIHRIELSKHPDRREGIAEFQDFLHNLVLDRFDRLQYPWHQFISVLSEILKNSADHTENDAFFGVDPMEDGRITFSMGDLGQGIHESVKKHFNSQRKPKGGHDETYRWALALGNSTSPDKAINRGLGMSIIIEGSRRMGIKLNVFDANSRFLLHKIGDLSYQNIRRNYYDLTKPVGFYYFGVLEGVNANNY